MQSIKRLKHEERVFLAGCIRAITMANGIIEEEELADIDKIIDKLKFNDYEECLVEFEENIPDKEAFYEYAKQIKDKKAQDIILSVVYELTLQEGAPDESEESIFNTLNSIWR
ncbi:MAG: hypothetical protein J7K04_11830 [Spirochaetales bacterium]|nr:hypothetical protein [Spirochaetales bacterium]